MTGRGAGLAVGIDMGALAVKVAVMDGEGRIVAEGSRAHQGNPIKALLAEAEALDLDGQVTALAVAGTNRGLMLERANVAEVDLVKAMISAVREAVPDARNIIDVGGGSITLIQLDETGRFRNYATNSLCAAGTGSFLDEQAGRLGLNYDALTDFHYDATPPNVATRCAVFAKSDLIHRQQEGYSREACWSGLCRGLTSTFLQTLLKGKPLLGRTVLTGGVSRNGEVLRWLQERLPDVVTFPGAHLVGARGAAALAQPLGQPFVWESLNGAHGPAPVEISAPSRRKPLALTRSRYPDFHVSEAYTDDQANEVRVTFWPDSPTVEATLGIDVGSTSTKLILVDKDGKVLVDIYRKTGGDPITATKLLFEALNALAESKNTTLRILGAGTTGSGRKLVGAVVGADAIINEITAHVTGAMAVDPTIDTIFEIGGQDSKFMRTRLGKIHDSAMNYVCAAGTGSFVEEQAAKLNVAIADVGPMVMNISPPLTSDRCTVFMEQDVHRLIRQGHSREEVLAGVLYSVAQNYLNKVVGNRAYSREKIFFQGATARNKGLVAAFENLLGVEVVVSPYCHVMGAYGVALHVAQTMTGPTRFRGLDLASRHIRVATERCDLCQNHCSITTAIMEGSDEKPSFGYMCGRDPEEKKVRLQPGAELLRRREKLLRTTGQVDLPPDAPQVGMPRALTSYSFDPLWRRFLGELGYKMVLSKPTNEETVTLGAMGAGSDFCFPVKVAHGHLEQLLRRDGLHAVLAPHMISHENHPPQTNSYFCPYVQTTPSLVRTALAFHQVDLNRLRTPVIDFRWNDRMMVGELTRELGPVLGRGEEEIHRAWQAGLQAYQEFGLACEEAGRRALERLQARGEKGLVILGRPYNTLDARVSLSLPDKMAEMGFTVFPVDLLPVREPDLGPAFVNIYWSYGQRILSLANRVKQSGSLYAVYLTSFNCGPDSFLLSYTEALMGDKPLLILELDEHESDGGYLTRIEAFADVVASHSKARRAVQVPAEGNGGSALRGHGTGITTEEDWKKRTLWIPPLHPIGTRLFAACFRGFGYNARPLPGEDEEAFELGRALTRGAECLPTAVTIGAFLKAVREAGGAPEDHALFMPTAEGPCRFGQYSLLHRLILDRAGYGGTSILCPTSYNTYQGLEEPLRVALFPALMAGDLVMKAACRIRPYEERPGETDRVLERQIRHLVGIMERKGDLRRAVSEAMDAFGQIPRRKVDKPLVGIVGEIYVRCNTFCNEDVVGWIERLGGEAWLSPMTEWILYTALVQQWVSNQEMASLVDMGVGLIKNQLVTGMEHQYVSLADSILGDRMEPPVERVVERGGRYMPENFHGEAILTIGRTLEFIDQGAAVVVNCAPFTCMPGNLTTAIFQRIQQETGVPIVSMFYDGKGGLNERLGVYLANL